jgi:hypothetical protein
MNLDHELRHAFRRKPPPSDLTDRVMAQLEERNAGPPTRSSAWPLASRWLAAAAAIMLTAGGAQYYSHRQAVAEAERVQSDVRLALQITSEKLALLQRRLQEPHR